MISRILQGPKKLGEWSCSLPSTHEPGISKWKPARDALFIDGLWKMKIDKCHILQSSHLQTHCFRDLCSETLGSLLHSPINRDKDFMTWNHQNHTKVQVLYQAPRVSGLESLVDFQISLGHYLLTSKQGRRYFPCTLMGTKEKFMHLHSKWQDRCFNVISVSCAY